MNKKGFTLIELLSVVAVLGVLSLLVIPVTSSLINKVRVRSYNQQIDYILNAANNWLSENAVLLSKDEDNCISIQYLKDNEYLDNTDIINPIDDSLINGYIKFTYNNDYNQYDKEYVDTCN